MIDLINTDADEDEIPDFDAADHKDAEQSAADILANLALEAALTPKAAAILKAAESGVLPQGPPGGGPGGGFGGGFGGHGRGGFGR